MRLLNAKTLEFSEFVGDGPPYAILSHTWGDGEVSFQMMQSGFKGPSLGYEKIRRCCEMAVIDGFEYVWVDTCCIDKTSSAELSEAINSMYSWYRKSDVCYVHLADVFMDSEKMLPDLDMQYSRWFTRGWTLQELIAPESVIFFDKNWVELGTKASFRMLLVRITGIHEAVLRNVESMYDLSVAQKMSWASGRKTTRVEDVAYSLMGIFSVNMPLLYGEGRYAFIRLQEEIMRNLSDHSIFAWTGRSLYHDGLLADSPAFFDGSENIIPCPTRTSNPFSSTNKGIHLHLPIKNFQKANCQLAIDCVRTTDLTKSIVINMIRLDSSGQPETFRRDQNAYLHSIEIEKVVRDFKHENIFVKQPRIRTLPPRDWDLVLSMKSLQENGIALLASIPNTMLIGEDGDLMSIPINDWATYAFKFQQSGRYDFIALIKVVSESIMATLSVIIIFDHDAEDVFLPTPITPDIQRHLLHNFLRSPAGKTAQNTLLHNSGDDRFTAKHPAGWSASLSIRSMMKSGMRVRLISVKTDCAP